MNSAFKKIQKINLFRLFRLKSLTNTALYLLVIGAFFVFNFVVSTMPLRYDFSFGKAYTLSSSTKKIVKNLDDIVTIKFFASSDLPTRLVPLKNQVIDLLNEYKKENKGKISLKILDPKKDQNAAQEVKELNIPELQFSQLERDKYAVTASYFGIALTYGNARETLAQVTDVESLEYNITAAIYKMTKKELIKVGILGRQESFDPKTNELSTFVKVIQQQFELGFLDVSSKSATKVIDSSYKTILVFDTNSKEYDPQEINAIKKYIDEKGNAIFLVDGVWVEDNLMTAPAKHNFSPLLNEYGIKLNPNLVLSANAELVNFGNSLVSFLSSYPFWLKTNVVNIKTSYFSNVQQLTFPWASSLTIEKMPNTDVKEIVKTTKRSWEQKDNFQLNPENIPPPQPTDLKEFIIGAESKENTKGFVMVIPSSRFILDRYIKNSDNLEFILNVVNNYASGGALAGIRQRVVSFYPLPDIPDNTKDIFKYGNMLVLPLLFGVYGFVRLMRRR